MTPAFGNLPVEMLNPELQEEDFSEEEMEKAVKDAGFVFTRDSTGHVFLRNVEPE